MMQLSVLFPGDSEWTNLTHLVAEHSFTVHTQIMNKECKSVIDTAECELVYDQLITAKMLAAGPGAKIPAVVLDAAGMPVFTGYTAPEVKQQKREFVEHLKLSLWDNSWKLDKKIDEQLQMPSSIDETGTTVRDIYETLIFMAGYDQSYIVADGYGTDRTIRMIHVEKQEATYREILDTLLSEQGLVLTTTPSGQFTLYPWNRETYEPIGTVAQEIAVNEPFSIDKQDSDYDGVKVVWAKLDVVDDVRLYNSPLPKDSNGTFPGYAIPAGEYYPEDGDVIETYQRYRRDWLDTAYLYGESKQKNKDISLITSENQYTIATADDGVVITTEQYDTHQAKILFHNTAAEARKIYTFEIWGKALFRSSIQETVIPETASNPKELQSTYLFAGTQAESFGRGNWRLLRYGNITYTFTLYNQQYIPGDIITLEQGDPAIQTKAIILEADWRDEVPGVRYRVVGIAAFGDITAITRSYTRAKSGEGEPGESPFLIQVLSERGSFFREGQVQTVLYARVFHEGNEVTSMFSDADFRWSRSSDDPAADDIWNQNHYNTGGKTLTITNDDVQRRAVFTCELLQR